MDDRPPPRARALLRSTLVGVGLPLTAFAIQSAWWSAVQPFAWFLFYPAVFLAAQVGPGSGLTATALSAGLAWWAFIPPEHVLWKGTAGRVSTLVVFVGMGLLFTLVHGRLRRATSAIAEARDRAEQAKVELERAAEERRIFQALVENSSDFIGIAAPDGTPVYLNPAGRRLVGLAPDFPIGSTSILECYWPEARPFVTEVILPTMMEQGVWQGETAFRNYATGEMIPVSDTHFTVRDPATGRLLGSATICRDVSGARRAREAMEAAHAQLRHAHDEVTRLYARAQELDELKTRFFANVSHELRTPLALVLGPTERLLDDSATPDAVRRELEVVARNARTLLGHVGDLLDVAKLDAGAMVAEYADLDLAHLVRFVAGHFQLLATDKAVTFTVEAPEHVPVQVDPAKLRRVLFNLLSNAFKLTPDGGRVRVTLREVGDRVAVEVADSGPGVPADQRAAVFERFRQLGGGRASGGTGLGLAIAREFTLLLGGAVRVDDAPEGGARFTVELPRAAPAGVAVEAAAEVRGEEPLDRPRRVGPAPRSAATRRDPGLPGAPLVLVVEDDPDMNRFICETLPAAYRVATAFDGEEGLRKATELTPDLVLTDFMMPGMSGGELITALRRLPELATTPIVLLTASADESTKLKFLARGAQDYLTKPFSAEELRARAANLLARKQAEDRVRIAEAKFRGIVSTASDAILSIDDDQRIVLYNEGAERIFGWTAEEALGRPLEFLMPERFRAGHRHLVAGFAAGDAQARAMGAGRPEIAGLRKSGEEFPAEAGISKLRVGPTWLFTVVLRDVTQLRRFQREQRFLAEVGATLASTLDLEDTAAGVGRMAVREFWDWCILDLVTEAGAPPRRFVTCADPADAHLTEPLARYLPDPERQDGIGRILRTEKPLVLGEITPELIAALAHDATHRRLVEATRAHSAIGVPLIAHGRLVGDLVVACSRPGQRLCELDLPLVESFGRRAAMALDNARLHEQVERAVRQRDEVLAVVAHDLRSPLGVVRSQAQLLRRRLPARAGDGASEPLGSIERGAERMQRLIRDLLDIVRLDAGSLAIERARVRTARLLADVVASQAPVARAASIELRLDAASDLPDVEGDHDRLLQVFENLVGNAVKFTAPGGRVTLAAEPGDGGVRFRVADEGVGIAPEDLAHLFDRFWQARRTDRRGAGLGLSIAQGIVAAHGGRIEVESEVGRGTTFAFTVPGVRGAAAPELATVG